MTCKDLASEVNKMLGLTEENGYSDRTMGKWLHILGFNVEVQKKCIYFDGHER